MSAQELFCETRAEEVVPVVFCLSRFQAVPFPSLGLLVSLQNLEAAWCAWLGMSEIKSSATKSSNGLECLLVVCCSQVPTTSALKQRLV